ncbi:hypothetical protein FH972_023644 [Carpinus fangiana]|uniref:SKP1 component dimerisation domain-containing protein n=1 Tax=Carpinus fangiana TaxID=176857 RepID=A0A5N6KVS6_9ROSI|nr:hypothetical protein FH972_023644 [Carpinus fangiana]
MARQLERCLTDAAVRGVGCQGHQAPPLAAFKDHITPRTNPIVTTVQPRNPTATLTPRHAAPQLLIMGLNQAANYLDIKALLDVGCKTVANMIKGKSPEEIRKTFNIQNDFTAEEEEQIRRENEWAEDR